MNIEDLFHDKPKGERLPCTHCKDGKFEIAPGLYQECPYCLPVIKDINAIVELSQTKPKSWIWDLK